MHYFLSHFFDPASAASLPQYGLITAYVAAHVAFAAFFLPCSPLTIIAGATWGIFPGLLISIATSGLATATTFALGRLARSIVPVRKFLDKRLPARSRVALTRQLTLDWTTILAIQTNPLVPASSAGYLFGLCGMNFRSFMLSSMLATTPMQVVLVTTAAVSLDAISAGRLTFYTGTILASCSVGFALVVYLRSRRVMVKQSGDAKR